MMALSVFPSSAKAQRRTSEDKYVGQDLMVAVLPNARQRGPGGSSAADGDPGAGTDADKENAGDKPGEPKRRPSSLGVFSDTNAKEPGFYMVQKEHTESSEVVEVRRSSLVMSTDMLQDILKSKVDPSRLDQIQEQDLGDEVVLPFFCQTQKSGGGGRRECRCKVDPITGYVIHTCMTPSTTHATNTEALQSYICSEWGSRRGSQGRRDSEATEVDEEALDAFSGCSSLNNDDFRVTAPRDTNRKRIRNASMLAIVSSAGPTLAKTSEVEEASAENELAISFTNIRDVEDNLVPDGISTSSTPGSGVCSGISSRGDNGCGEQRVESELTHKFELLEPCELCEMLEDANVLEGLLVVDVRGRDWVGGCIPSSVNLRTSEVVAHPEALLKQCRQNNVHHVVFTCMYSVLRARKCAMALQQAQEESRKQGKMPYRIRLSLLAGGMHAWVNFFMKTPDDKPPKGMLYNFDGEMWSDGGPSQGGLVHVMDALWSSGGQKALSDALSQELEQLLIRRTSGDIGGSRRQSNQSQVSSAPLGGPPELPVVAVPPPVAPPTLPPLDGILEEDAAEDGKRSRSSRPKKGSFAEAAAALDPHAECGMPKCSSGPRKGSFDEAGASIDLGAAED